MEIDDDERRRPRASTPSATRSSRATRPLHEDLSMLIGWGFLPPARGSYGSPGPPARSGSKALRRTRSMRSRTPEQARERRRLPIGADGLVRAWRRAAGAFVVEVDAVTLHDQLHLDGRGGRVRPAPRGRHAAGDPAKRRARVAPVGAAADARTCSAGAPHDHVANSERARLRTDRELDKALDVAGIGRFRVNVAFERGALYFSFRRVNSERIASIEELGLPRGVRPADAAPARPRARHGPDRQRQVDDARRDDRPHQRARRAAHRDDRRPDRVRAPPTSGASSTSARSAPTRARSPRRCATCCARTPT